MPEKRAFNTKSFRSFEDAIYRMHRILKRTKQIFRSIKDPKDARKKVMRECVDVMQSALEEAKLHGDKWLSEIKEDATDSQS